MAEYESERLSQNLPLKNYIHNTKTQLLQLVFQGLLKINFEEDEDDDDWGHALSAACCLQKMSLLIKDEVLDPVIVFFSQNIIVENWKNKYASLMALGSVTEGPTKAKFSQLILQSLGNLLTMFGDQSVKVREAISWVMSRICEHHSDVVTHHSVMSSFLGVILNSLSDIPRVSTQCCQAIEKLAASNEPMSQDQQMNALTPYYKQIVESLFLNAKREDGIEQGINLAQSSYIALTSVVQNSCVQSVNESFQLLIVVLQELEKTLTPNAMGHERAVQLQDLLCGLVQVILIRVDEKVDEETAKKIIILIIQLFKQAQKVTESGLIAFQGLVVGAGSKIDI